MVLEEFGTFLFFRAFGCVGCVFWDLFRILYHIASHRSGVGVGVTGVAPLTSIHPSSNSHSFSLPTLRLP